MKRYSAVVVGLGQIGQGYDYGCDDDSVVVTHASSYRYHPGFDLVAGIDPDSEQRRLFERKYVAPAFSTVADLPGAFRSEVVSICVPTVLHAETFFAALERAPRAVLCEKPIAGTVEEAAKMVSAARAAGCVLAVNYMRRFEPGVLSLREMIEAGGLGDIYKGVVWYGKGLRNNGSHFVDLLRFLLGEAEAPRVFSKGRRWENHDPEPDVCVRFGNTDVYFLAAREECFTVAEFELVGTKGRIAYRGGGESIETWGTEEDRAFPGYTVLNAKAHHLKNDYRRYEWHVVDHLYRRLTEGSPLNSDGESATSTLRVIEQIVSLL